MSLERIQTLLTDCQNDNDRLFDLNVKCTAASLRKKLQLISQECKELRRLALDHRKSLPVKKRVKKTDEDTDETKEEKKEELSEPTALEREVTSSTTAQEAVDIEKERAELQAKLALLDSDK